MDWIDAELSAVPSDHRRRISQYDRGAGATITIQDRKIVNFTSNNYLSLACHPEVIEAGARAMRDHGAGAGSSRLISGTNPIVAKLEEETAELKGTPAALTTTSGFTAALSVIPVLAEKSDGIAIEHGAHASLVTASRLSGARLAVFRRGKENSLAQALNYLRKKNVRRMLIVVDGLHSMDGDVAPLDNICAVGKEHGAMLLLDDAHATGVLGPRGEGSLAYFGLNAESSIIQIGNYAKAFGSQGGFIAASRPIIDLIVQRSVSFIYTTGICPSAAGAALEAMRIHKREPARLDRLRTNINAFRKNVPGTGGDGLSPIISILVGPSSRTLEIAREILELGALVSAIRPPTVPKGTARLRISLQAEHGIFIEGADHASKERYLIFLRRTAAQKIANSA